MIFLSLGSNLGDRLTYLSRACALLSQKIEIIEKSSIYETSPVGGLGGAYLNQVLCVETSLSARELLSFCLHVEREIGRERSVRNAPRTIDIDVLVYGKEIIDEGELIVPHPRMHLRKFVLVPLCEIASQRVHPLLGKTFRELLESLESDEEVRFLAAGPACN